MRGRRSSGPGAFPGAPPLTQDAVDPSVPVVVDHDVTADHAVTGHGHRGPERLSAPALSTLARSADDRVVAGVAGGIGRWLGVDSVLVRLAFVLLSTAAGFGLIAYVVARFVLPDPATADVDQVRETSVRHAAGLLLVTAGMLLLLRSIGAWVSDSLSWSVGLAAVGSGVVWTRATEAERTRWRAVAARTVGEGRLPDLDSIGRFRLLLGTALVFAGLITFLITSGPISIAVDVAIALLGTLVGAALLAGPYLQRLYTSLAEERRARIRSEERADMAAHLHDSVLQTLALIQRAPSSEDMAKLARAQERELRAWLFGRRPDAEATRLGEAVTDIAARVEERFGAVKVEVVMAGDVDLAAQRSDLLALVEASGEAMANAARHAGVDRVDVFVEVEPRSAAIFVRDEGRGFDADDVAADRRGLSESIRGRMARHGGTAVVTSTPGEGCEVELQLPLRPGASGTDGVAENAETEEHPHDER